MVCDFLDKTSTAGAAIPARSDILPMRDKFAIKSEIIQRVTKKLHK